MADKKNIILAFGNKEFNNSLTELKEFLSFNLKTTDNLLDCGPLENYQGLIVHEDALKDTNFKKLTNNKRINMIIFHNSKTIKITENAEKLNLPATFNQIDKIVVNNIVKKKFKDNSSLEINNYNLDKNMRSQELNQKMLKHKAKDLKILD